MNYSFPDHLQAVYSQVHSWLEGMEDTHDYRFGSVQLDYQNIRQVATLFHKYFPAHYFKVAATLKEVIGHECMTKWVKGDGRICIVDVGCGSGAATCAAIEAFRLVATTGERAVPVHLHLIGIDPEQAAMVVYRAMLDRIKKQPDFPQQLTVTHEFLCDKMPNCSRSLLRMLQKRAQIWDLPALPHTVILQVNTVRAYEEQGVLDQVPNALRTLFDKTPIDRLYAVSIGTSGYQQQIQHLDSLMRNEFTGHFIAASRVFERSCTYSNPDDSFYRNEGKQTWKTTFNIASCSYISGNWQNDQPWQEVISLENLQLAWARTRNALLRESLVDEVEIRLSDQDVKGFLDRLKSRLEVYASDLFQPRDFVNYEFPKSALSTRPKSLTRFEEEILSTAIIQVAGDEYADGRRLYAHRLNRVEDGKSEYLYAYFGHGYQQWIEDARKAARSEVKGMVLWTDIQSYYTKIHQERLVSTLLAEMRCESDRIRWLLKALLVKRLDPDSHRIGYGLSQGGVGSGYYANVYLAAIDDYFVGDNPFGAHYFRYADDIIVIIPDEDDVAEVRDRLDKFLSALDLCRNEEKTECFKCSEFDDRVMSSWTPDLDQLSTQLNALMKPLWTAASQYHSSMQPASVLYSFLEWYRLALRELRVFVPIPMLRRKMVHERKGAGISYSLVMPDFSGLHIDKGAWASQFADSNTEWLSRLDELRSVLERMVSKILKAKGEGFDDLDRAESTRVRFAIGRLCQVGMSEDMANAITSILKCAPHWLREPSFVLDSLAIQGFEDCIFWLYHCYSCSGSEQSYLRTMTLRSMRYCRSANRSLLLDLVVDQSEAIEVRLLASESLLFLRIDSIGYTHWAQINNALSNEELTPRLRKNLILLLKLVGDRDPQTFEPRPDDVPILFDAYDVREEGRLFDLAEPMELLEYIGISDPDDAYEYGELMDTASH